MAKNPKKIPPLAHQLKTRTLDKKLLKPVQFTRVEASSSGFQGMLDKFGLTLGKDSFIIKPRVPMFPELPENEFLANQIADLLGIQVAEYGYWKMGRDFVFVSKNFMTVSKSKDALIHFNRLVKDEWSCQSIVKSIQKKSTQPDPDLHQFISVCLFDSLIGNSDRHSRNLAYLYKNGKYRLAPIYDNVSVMIAKKLSYSLIKNMDWGGKIRTKSSESPDFQNYIAEFRRLGLSKTLDSILAKIKKSAKQITALVDHSHLSTMNKFLLKERIEEAFGGLK
jgi:hypothetical protein